MKREGGSCSCTSHEWCVCFCDVTLPFFLSNSQCLILILRGTECIERKWVNGNAVV